MKRGEIWWVQFAEGVGGEIRKRRPAVIISSDEANKHLNRVQVVPLTSSVARLYPGEAVVMVRGVKHKAMANQIMTASKLRFQERVDCLGAADVMRVEQAIRIQLGLTPATPG